MTGTFVNFGNSFNSIILSPLSSQEKISSKNAVQEEWAIPLFLEDNDKNLRRVLHGGNEQFQFFDSQMYCNNLNAITLKLFHNHGGIYRFRKKFKKDSGEIKPLRVYRNMRVCILEINYEGLGW